MSFAKRLTKLLLHGSAIYIMVYGFNSLFDGTIGLHLLVKDQVGGHFQFLTIQGLFLAGFTMACSLITDLIPSFTAFHSVKRTLMIVSLPIAVVISSIYWTLLLAFPTLILPSLPIDPSEPSSSGAAPALARIPLSVDVSLHAVPAISLLLDFLFFERKYSKKAAYALGPVLALAYAVGYGWWVEYCAKHNGVFPYPFLTENPFDVRVGIYGGAMCIAILSFWGLNALHP